MIRCSTSYAQIPDTNYIPTHKDVLKYLYEQDVDCKFLEKDTLKKSKEIKLLNGIIDEQKEEYSDCNDRISIEKERNKVNNSTISTLKNDLKTEKRNVFIWKLATIVSSVAGVFSSIWFLLH